MYCNIAFANEKGIAPHISVALQLFAKSVQNNTLPDEQHGVPRNVNGLTFSIFVLYCKGQCGEVGT